MKKKELILTLVFLLIDMISKLLIDNYLLLGDSTLVIKNFFALTKVYNYGASWSILRGQRWFLIILAILILLCLFKYQKKFRENSRNLLAFSLMYAGILGNLINRLILGYVIDFFDFKIFNYSFPVFNWADVFIILGVILLIYAIIKKEDEK